MRRFASTWPGIESPVEPALHPDFEEPSSHIRARQILGKDFHGISAVEKHLGAFTQSEREERKILRLRNHQTGEFLSEEATLALLEACKGECVLCAMHECSLLGIHQQKKAFTADPNQPWFEEPSQVQAFAGAVNPDPWVLMRKAILPESTGKTIDAQKKHLGERFPQERCILPSEFAEIAIVHYRETGEKLGGNYVIRFFVQTAGGYWLSVDWYGDRLCFSVWYDSAYDDIGSLSARTS